MVTEYWPPTIGYGGKDTGDQLVGLRLAVCSTDNSLFVSCLIETTEIWKRSLLINIIRKKIFPLYFEL